MSSSLHHQELEFHVVATQSFGCYCPGLCLSYWGGQDCWVLLEVLQVLDLGLRHCDWTDFQGWFLQEWKLDCDFVASLWSEHLLECQLWWVAWYW